MIFIDFNNASSRHYSQAIELALEEEKKNFKRNGLVDIQENKFNRVKKAYFNLAIKDLFYVIKKYQDRYGSLAVAVDGKKDMYWRKLIFPQYKEKRGKNKNAFDKEAYKYFGIHRDELISLLKEMNMFVFDKLETTYLDKEVSIEADEIISVLTTKLPQRSLIISTDKDFMQLTENEKISVYNPIKREMIKWNKKEINDYNNLQLMIGQTGKGESFSIKHETELHKDFIKFMLDTYDVEVDNTMINDLDIKYKTYVQEYRTLRKKESDTLIKEGKRKRPLVLSPFANANFGEVTYNKLLKSSGNKIDKILDTNPLYRKRYELNRKIYLLKEVPRVIEDKIVDSYIRAEKVFNKMRVENEFMSLGIELSLLDSFM